MSDIRSLGYLGLETEDLVGWDRYATEVLGLMRSRYSSVERVQFRMDEHPHRFSVTAGEKDGLVYTGWEVANAEVLQRLAARLGEAGYQVAEGSSEELKIRRVNGMVWCEDPSGFRVEFYHGRLLDHSRFISPVGVKGFVTGDQGLGHIVLLAKDFEASYHFYHDLLGFRLSDYMMLGDLPLRFMGCNPRHHSLAIAPHHSSRLAHLMVEVSDIDEVGFCLDRCAKENVVLAQSLGRHTNDKMVSFYMRAPRGYEVEFGYGARAVDEATWVTTEITAVSDWGHARQVK